MQPPRLPRVAVRIFLLRSGIESLEEARLWLRRNVVPAQAHPKLRVRSAVSPGTRLRPRGFLRQLIAAGLVLMCGPHVRRGPWSRSSLFCVSPPAPSKDRRSEPVVLLPPMAAFPPHHPLRDPSQNVIGVRRDFHFARLLERQQPLNRRPTPGPGFPRHDPPVIREAFFIAGLGLLRLPESAEPASQAQVLPGNPEAPHSTACPIVHNVQAFFARGEFGSPLPADSLSSHGYWPR